MPSARNSRRTVFGETVSFSSRPSSIASTRFPTSDRTARATGTPPAAGRSIVSLRQNRPNPFNPGTEIEFTLAEPRYVALRVYDVGGRLVRTLWDGLTPAGSHSTTWNGDDTAGKAVASGVYFYELQAAEERVRKRMVLVR